MQAEQKNARAGLLRLVLVLVFVATLAVQVVRTAAVAQASTSSVLAARIWPSHPEIMNRAILLRAGQAAASGRTLDASAVALVEQLLKAEPLSAEPLLITAALEEKAGRFGKAERLLVEARKRDPRAPAARLLLAQALLRRGDTLGALEEMAVLSRLIPGSFGPLTATLAAYARAPSGVGDLKRLISKRPDLEEPLLAALAADPSNTPAILALASSTQSLAVGAKPPAWQPRLLNGLVAQGRFDLAKAVWRKVTGRPLGQGIYNPRFTDTSAPQPFNWMLAQSGGAIAEPDQGRLHVVHFGDDDMIIVAQTLLLAPGRYRLSLTLAGQSAQPGQLTWRVLCLPAARPILDLPVSRPPKRRVLEGEFNVPAVGCGGQKLELVGRAQDFPEDADVRFGNLRLIRLPS